jgi:hypothetical protein
MKWHEYKQKIWLFLWHRIYIDIYNHIYICIYHTKMCVDHVGSIWCCVRPAVIQTYRSVGSPACGYGLGGWIGLWVQGMDRGFTFWLVAIWVSFNYMEKNTKH